MTLHFACTALQVGRSTKLPTESSKGNSSRRTAFLPTLLYLSVTLIGLSTTVSAQDDMRPTSLSTVLKGGIGVVFRTDPSEVIDGGFDAALHVVPFDLGILNLGIDTALISASSTASDTGRTDTYYAGLAVSASKYFARDDWLAFPYVAGALGLWTKFVVSSDEFTSELMPFEPEEGSVEADYEPTFWDSFRFGPGLSLEAGFLVPLREFLYLVLSYSVDLSFVDSTFDFRVGSDVGVSLHLHKQPDERNAESREDS